MSKYHARLTLFPGRKFSRQEIFCFSGRKSTWQEIFLFPGRKSSRKKNFLALTLKML